MLIRRGMQSEPPREVIHETLRLDRTRRPEPARVGAAELAYDVGDEWSGGCREP